MEILEMQIGIEKLIFVGIGALFIIEQIFYWFLGSYIYRYGILLKRIAIVGLAISLQCKERKHPVRLAIKKNDIRKEIYIRYRYPTAIIGPIIFVGQINYIENKLMIRIGPISAIFILSLVAFSLISGGFYGFLNCLIILSIVVWFYLRFYNLIQSISPDQSAGKNGVTH
jgi:hypothetical protein